MAKAKNPDLDDVAIPAFVEHCNKVLDREIARLGIHPPRKRRLHGFELGVLGRRWAHVELRKDLDLCVVSSMSPSGFIDDHVIEFFLIVRKPHANYFKDSDRVGDVEQISNGTQRDRIANILTWESNPMSANGRAHRHRESGLRAIDEIIVRYVDLYFAGV